ncbi:MAG TPA: c-type cytochrome [Polyangiaceae bacterium]
MLELFRKLFELPPGASSFADGIDWLHLFVIGMTLLGVTAITLLALLFVIRYRQRPGDDSTPVVRVTGKREAILVFGTLGLFLLWWVLGYRQYLAMRARPAGADAVYVSAKQWMWKFSHSQGQIENDVLTVPVGRPVELIMISRDVIHSFYVPAMRVKQDVLPGRYVTLWFKPVRVGTYPIYCAEYCGVLHSGMLGAVRVLTDAEYSNWLEDGARARPLADLGRSAAVKHACLSCHTIDGQKHIGPTWSRLYGSDVTLTDGQHVVADAAYLTESMMDPAAHIVQGYAPIMPTYLGSLAPSETAAIVEYIRSLQDSPVTPSVRLPALQVVPVASASSTQQGAP